jgi:hypothetical protein
MPVAKWKKAGWARPGGKRKREVTPDETKLIRKIGARIKRLRVEARITSAELGATIGITPSIEFLREAGRINFTVGDLLRYSKALKIKLTELVG